ncbi:transglycosylase SLT domain-containing protein [Curtobacterium sp. MCBD17_040]|uniref:aggregation-promoting factor C-terminal-like domain-containing protein n=1 Tax=Curtobacterium sp. MCBD17_040 TaxID=2175674 RepID=UPI000DA9D8F9|nr:transglycosylase SLT domain-containing protein [Curtobacterium sp. MCBD17_040]WIB65415.1 transglycosylase SLT domain-containing protein [Curtobacterium sp. MCBD17_040]
MRLTRTHATIAAITMAVTAGATITSGSLAFADPVLTAQSAPTAAVARPHPLPKPAEQTYTAPDSTTVADVSRDGFTVTAPKPKPKAKAVPTPAPAAATPAAAAVAHAAAATAVTPATVTSQVPAATTWDTSAGSNQAYASSQLASYGWGQDQMGCLVSLWNQESSWNPSAENPSGAYGIPQALPGSKMSSAGADWQTNPHTQITWGLQYIQGTYGIPCAAWSHETSAGWY